MVLFAFDIDSLQFIAAFDVLRRHDVDQPHHLAFEILALAVQVVEQRMDGVEVGTEAGIEVAQVAPADVSA